MPKKLSGYQLGRHTHMRLRLDDNTVEDIDVYFDGHSTRYYTTADGDQLARNLVISAYKQML